MRHVLAKALAKNNAIKADPEHCDDRFVDRADASGDACCHAPADACLPTGDIRAFCSIFVNPCNHVDPIYIEI